jgi:uncharacterized Zn-finger protein
MNFSSNKGNAQKSMTKAINHRIERLSSLLESNVTNICESSIEHENELNETSEYYSCSSPIKKEPFFMPKSKRFIRRHKCETCKKRFISPSKLNIHERIHSKEKPFACDQCQMNFSNKSNFSRHKRVHTGEKPFHCDECPKKFSHSFNLTSHKRVHTGEKPFNCDICQMKFRYLASVTKHQRIHSGDKPYQCDICLMKFSLSSNLTRHKEFTHE